MEPFVIERSVMPEPAKRGPKNGRIIAKKAADAIRKGEYNNLNEAAHAFFNEHVGYEVSKIDIQEDKNNLKDRFKDFIRYIYNDLKDKPTNFRIYWIIAESTKNRRRQWPKRRKKKIIDFIQNELKKLDVDLISE